MADTLIFRTPGLIDLRAFTVMGFNAKPHTTNPIGYFGTGLKYAVAVLCRLGSKPVVYIGRDKYTFYAKTVDFRGQRFDQVWMRSDRWKMRARNTELPFTTIYGRNWQPWMVFRELESNTRDEGGNTYLVDYDPQEGEGSFAAHDETVIAVDHPEVIKAFEERDMVFLNTEEHAWRAEDAAVTVRSGGGTQLYYRGIRAKDTTKPTLFTYDFKNTHGLTEDRTFENEYWVRQNLGSFVATCEDEDVIKAVVTAPEGNWEYGLEIPPYVKPSEAFHRVIHSRPRGLSPVVSSYYHRHDNRPTLRTTSPWQEAPRPWRVNGDTVEDARGNTLFGEPYNFAGRWDLLAEELARVGNVFQQAPGPEEAENAQV